MTDPRFSKGPLHKLTKIHDMGFQMIAFDKPHDSNLLCARNVMKVKSNNIMFNIKLKIISPFIYSYYLGFSQKTVIQNLSNRKKFKFRKRPVTGFYIMLFNLYFYE